MTSISHAEQRAAQPRQATRRYDIIKDGVIAFIAVAVLTVGLSALFSSPDEKPITMARWAQADPNDFVATAVSELAGTSASAGYGPPYNSTAGASQQLGPLKLEQWAGVTQPVNSAQAFVLTPLASVPGDATLAAAIASYNAAPPTQQQKWASDYADALSKAPNGSPAAVKAGDYGPVPVLAGRLLDEARAGTLDGTLQSENGFYNSDYTKSLLFISDGSYLANLAQADHLAGDQWGMMNETGNFPGQAWLWLYTFWYQISPFNSSSNADVQVWALMAVLTLGLIFLPFIPGFRSLPRLLGVYRLIWRQHYRALRAVAVRPVDRWDGCAVRRGRLALEAGPPWRLC